MLSVPGIGLINRFIPSGQLWQDIRGTILRQDGCIDLYIGSGVESPDVAQLFVSKSTPPFFRSFNSMFPSRTMTAASFLSLYSMANTHTQAYDSH